MPPKKSTGGGGGKKKERKVKVSDFTDADLECFIKNYTGFCTAAGLPVHEPLVKCLTELKHEFDGGGNENLATRQFLIAPTMKDGRMVDPEEPRLGPGGCRAMCTAILATGPGMAKAKPTDPGGPFAALRSIRIWHNRIGDDGAAAVAEVLRLGGAEVKLVYLELWHNLIGARGCRALGEALRGCGPLCLGGGNRSLEGLKLDHNPLGSKGLDNLARGLRSNAFLKQLSVSHCQIGPEACGSLGQALCFDQSKLSVLNLSGNHIGDAGLLALCTSLQEGGNKPLSVLNLADNQLGTHSERSVGPFTALGKLVAFHPALSVLDLDWNRLCVEAGETLLPWIMDPNNPRRRNPRLKEVRIDCQLGFPDRLFHLLNFKGGAKKVGGRSKKRSKSGKGRFKATSQSGGQVLSLAESALMSIEGDDQTQDETQLSGMLSGAFTEETESTVDTQGGSSSGKGGGTESGGPYVIPEKVAD